MTTTNSTAVGSFQPEKVFIRWQIAHSRHTAVTASLVYKILLIRSMLLQLYNEGMIINKIKQQKTMLNFYGVMNHTA